MAVIINSTTVTAMPIVTAEWIRTDTIADGPLLGGVAFSSMAASRGTDGTPNADWHARFIEVLRDVGAVRYAAEAAGVPRSTAYRHRAADTEFAAAWADALEDSCDELDVEARRRAIAGSDGLLQFLLRAHRPGTYGDKRRIEHALEVAEAPLADEEVERELESLARALPGWVSVHRGPESVTPPVDT
jgi:hypothetical protein